MFILRHRTGVLRSRALTLVSLIALLTFALTGLPHVFHAKSAVPFEASQTINWIPTNPNNFVQTVSFKQLAAQGSRIWAATDGYGVFYTDNYGQSWLDVIEGLTRDNRSTKTILLTPTHLFAGTTGGVFKTPYNNPSLVNANNGLQLNGLNLTIFHLKSYGSDVLLAGTSSTVYRSTDSGANWTRVSSGIFNSLAIVSFYVVGNVIYAGSDYNGVYRSTDAGLTWISMSNGLVAGRVNCFLQVGNALLAGSGFEGLWRSTNSAESWEKIGNGLSGNAKYIHDLIQIGSDIYAATEDGVYRSSDAGLNWQPVKTGLTGYGLTCNSLLFLDNYLYVGTEGGVYRAALSNQATPTPTPTPTGTPTPTPNPNPTPTPTATPSPTPNGRVVQIQSGNSLAGGTVTLAVNLTSLGNENTVGLSVNFDSSVLSYQSSAKGTDATSLLKNEIQAGTGRIGLAATVDQGQSFPAGSRQLATLTFSVIANTTATSTALTVVDQPIPRQVVAPDATSLTAGTSFLGGTITLQNGYEGDVTPRPTGKNNGFVNLSDYVQIGRFAIGLDQVSAGSEFQRADCAPRTTKGDGSVNLADYVQAGRFAIGLDAVSTVGGPTAPTSFLPESSASGARVSNQTTRSIARAVTARMDEVSYGETVVHIGINALGDESAVGWSVNFNPADWRFVRADDAAVNTVLSVNTEQTAAGRLGVALVLKPGTTLPIGTQQMVELHFAATKGTPRAFTFGFADRPLKREIVDRGAESVPGRFNIGVTATRVTSAAIVSAADLVSTELAPNALASAFGTGFSTESATGDTLPLATSLAGTSVSVRDSQGVERKAGLLFVSPSQINYEIPAGTASGVSTVEVLRSDPSTGHVEVVALGVVGISPVAPSLFTAGATGNGLAAAVFAQSDGLGNLSYTPVAVYESAGGGWIPNPFKTGIGEQPVYLVLFGTGLRGSQTVRVFLGGDEVMPTFSGAQGNFAGLDQINVPIPKSLMHSGDLAIRVKADGQSSNIVHVVVD